MSNFMHSLERKMLDYKEGQSEELLNEIITDPELKMYIKGIARKKEIHSMTGLNDKDDLYAVGISRVWSAIMDFKFFCPICNKILKTEDSYIKHCRIKHGTKNWLQPKKNIVEMVKYHIGVYIHNELRKERSKKNQANAYNIKTPEVLQSDSTNSQEWGNLAKQTEVEKVNGDFTTDVLFNELLRTSTATMDEQSKEILIMLLNGSINKDIAEELYRRGKYKSLDSASVMVSKIIKMKIRPHFAWLKQEVACG